jgi:glycosyltransferase involved in cell wall biosynthesis
MAAGLPIVGIDAPWIRQLVRPGTNGLLADPQASALARVWARMVKDPALRTRLAEGALTASERYSVHRTTARVVNLYRHLVEDRLTGSHG